MSIWVFFFVFLKVGKGKDSFVSWKIRIETFTMKWRMLSWITLVCIGLYVSDMYNYVSQILFDGCIQVLFYQ